MSRVHNGQKWMNTTKYPSEITNATKIVHMKGEHPDYTKASSLTDWLFLKYDMTYKQYRNKSKSRRDSLRAEFMEDTGRKHFTRKEQEEADLYALLAEIGVPFDPMGEPLGIG